MSPHIVSTPVELRKIYGTAHADSLAVKCVLPYLDKHHRSFIVLSPFFVIASADTQGLTDVSPRGDLPGFVTVLDDRTLLLPDRPGNKKLETLGNLLQNPTLRSSFLCQDATIHCE